MSAINVPVPCPREGLAALYDTRYRTLIVSAKGKAPNWMIGIRIQQETIMGGLKFALLSSAGGLGTPDEKAFDVKHKLPITLPNRVVGKDIIFVTATNPHGFLIPIEYTGYNPPVDAPADESTGAATPGSVLPPIPIFVSGEGKQFGIKAAADAGPMGGVNIAFDDTVLKLVNAGMQGSDVVWTFETLKLGRTLVDVTTEYLSLQSLKQFVKIQGYLVDVGLTGEPAAEETKA
ncbi:hypothetical protein MMC17_002737 [Xylographa soralifera]|nr:hypothetical protein [Xylographa soralifera]